ncbi:hypothetical protein TNCV_4022511 [Trichonephila clavipes]|nr:hypothetical protein TNCV_4022511 [Trichonephila clavipes]
MRAFGDEPCNFKPWSSDVDDIRAGTPLLTTTSDRFNVHRFPRWGVLVVLSRTRDKACNDPIPLPLGYHGHTIKGRSRYLRSFYIQLATLFLPQFTCNFKGCGSSVVKASDHGRHFM